MSKEVKLNYSEILLIRQALALMQSSAIASAEEKMLAEKLGWQLKDASAVVLRA